MSTRWLVSVESLDIPARPLILKHLQLVLGAGLLQDHRCHAGARRWPSCFELLHCRLASLGKRTEAVLVSDGSWLLPSFRHALLKPLHAKLGAALVTKYGLENVRHLMICLCTTPDEAFETLIQEYAGREITLQTLRVEQQAIDGVAEKKASAASPFPVTVVRVDCPAFVADNPASMTALANACAAACSEIES